MLHRDLQLLHEVNAVEEQGKRLEGDLQNEVQESRRRFLRILLEEANPAQMDREARSMRSYDSTITATESRITTLNAEAALGQQEFHERWLSYVSLRDKILETVLAGGPGRARRVDPDLAKGALESAVQAARNAESNFAAISASHVVEVSNSLNATLRELFLLVGVKILVLSLLVWSDWKRLRAENQLLLARRELREIEDKLHLAYESAAVGMGIIALDGTILSMNKVAAKILGYESQELIGRKVRELIAPPYLENHFQQLASLANSQESSYRTERQYIRKDGSPVWIRNNVNLMTPKGEDRQCFFTSEEITLQKQANDRLAYLANYDPITNLPNRHFFEEQLALAMAPTPGLTDCVALLYLEIDSFDFLKGTFGRNVADEVLNELGGSLAAFKRDGETLGRLDDHVFGMLVKAAPYDEATMHRAGELRDIFRSAGESGKHRIPLSASIGIAFSNDQSGKTGEYRQVDSRSASSAGSVSSGADTLLKFARAAMLEARSRGGDTIFVADPSLQERAAQRHQIESALLRGLREDEFRVVFQPQFEIASGKLIRFEALCRWTSAELGPIPPDRFIPIAEQTGLIMEIGRRVMQDALQQAKSWTDSGRLIGVAINISPMQFMRPDFPHIITEALALSDFPPALLELEITEGIFIRDLNLAVARIRELQRLGLSVALDDFGTGYSSLSYLQKMPIDAVKLDRSFVSDLTTDVATVSMVRSVLAMADALNLRVVTEGVETEQQLEILRALGCDEAQGYLLGRPESAEMALRRVLESPLLPLLSLGSVVRETA